MTPGSDILALHEHAVDGALVVEARLHGKGTLNLVDQSLLQQAADEMTRLLARPDLRCVLLTGANSRAFIGGADLHVLGALDLVSAGPFIRAIHEFCRILRTARVPVVAVMRGHCLGAGLEIAAACDFRLGDDTVWCGMPEVRVGVPSVVEAALLPGLIGWGKTRELLLRGNLVDAAEALRIGILQHLCPAADLGALALAAATDLVAGMPRALAAQKQLFLDWEEKPVSGAILAGIDAFVDAYGSDEPAAGAARFFAARDGRRTE